MTNKIAVVTFLVLVFALAVDVLLYGPVHVIFLGKRFFELIEWVAFWR